MSATQAPQTKALTTAQQNVNTFAALLDRSKGELSRAVPKHVDADRLARVALTLVRTTPALLDCEPKSILAGVMMSAQLGLELGMIGHAYLVPFNNRKSNRKEAQFIIGYRGMIDLARRSGNIKAIKAEIVWTGDLFQLKYGLEDELVHVPYHCREDGVFEKGVVRGAYAVAHFVEGGHALLYMPKAEIEEHRNRSRAKDSGPWVTDYPEMCKKTVVRGIFKWLPISIEVNRGVESNDETSKLVIDADMTTVPDAELPDPFAGAEDATVVEETPPAPAPATKKAPAPVAEVVEEDAPKSVDLIAAYGIKPTMLAAYMKGAGVDPKPLEALNDQEAARVLAHIEKIKGAR